MLPWFDNVDYSWYCSVRASSLIAAGRRILNTPEPTALRSTATALTPGSSAKAGTGNSGKPDDAWAADEGPGMRAGT